MARAGDRGAHAKSEAAPPLDPMAAAKPREADKWACSCSNSLHPCACADHRCASQSHVSRLTARLATGHWQRASEQERTLHYSLTDCSFDTNGLTRWAVGSPDPCTPFGSLPLAASRWVIIASWGWVCSKSGAISRLVCHGL